MKHCVYHRNSNLPPSDAPVCMPLRVQAEAPFTNKVEF